MRQGGAMLRLFAIFIDDIATKFKSNRLSCNTILTCSSIFIYAENIINIMLITHSVTMIQTMLQLRESELLDLDVF